MISTNAKEPTIEKTTKHDQKEKERNELANYILQKLQTNEELHQINGKGYKNTQQLFIQYRDLMYLKRNSVKRFENIIIADLDTTQGKLERVIFIKDAENSDVTTIFDILDYLDNRKIIKTAAKIAKFLKDDTEKLYTQIGIIVTEQIVKHMREAKDVKTRQCGEFLHCKYINGEKVPSIKELCEFYKKDESAIIRLNQKAISLASAYLSGYYKSIPENPLFAGKIMSKYFEIKKTNLSKKEINAREKEKLKKMSEKFHTIHGKGFELTQHMFKKYRFLSFLKQNNIKKFEELTFENLKMALEEKERVLLWQPEEINVFDLMDYLDDKNTARAASKITEYLKNDIEKIYTQMHIMVLDQIVKEMRESENKKIRQYGEFLFCKYIEGEDSPTLKKLSEIYGENEKKMVRLNQRSLSLASIYLSDYYL